jgi:hypothetical protein
MDFDFSKAAQECQRYDPDLWQRCCPRRYANANGYRSFDVPAVSMFSTIRGAFELGRFPDGSSQTIYRVVWHLIRDGVPTLFVAPEFGRAVMETEPPSDILWTEAHLPHEAAILMLPEGLFLDLAGKSLPFVSFSRMRAGDTYREINREVQVASDILSFHTLTSVTGPMGLFSSYEMTLNSLTTKQANIRDLTFDRVLSKEEDTWLLELVRFVLKFALIVESRPTLLGRVEMIRKPGKGKSALWSPNIVGKGYGMERKAKSETGVEGTGRSGVRTHWRRGHLRNQAFGTGWIERKVIWIEPVLVK